MTKNVYAVRDIKTSWLDPFIEYNDDSAMRAFLLMVHNPSTLIGLSRCDFELYRIGSYDISCGKFIPLESNIYLMCGKDVPENEKS